MNKQIIEQAAEAQANFNWPDSDRYPLEFDFTKKDFIAGAEFALPKWIPVSERLPEKNCRYGSEVLATDGKVRWTCHYTTGDEIEVEMEDSDIIFLKTGWYECEEQREGEYEEVWFERSPTHWMTLPSLPKTL